MVSADSGLLLAWDDPPEIVVGRARTQLSRPPPLTLSIIQVHNLKMASILRVEPPAFRKSDRPAVLPDKRNRPHIALSFRIDLVVFLGIVQNFFVDAAGEVEINTHPVFSRAPIPP
jgi:hypothetical protein